MGLSILNRDDIHLRGNDFDMPSFVEDHMSKEDLGPEAIHRRLDRPSKPRTGAHTVRGVDNLRVPHTALGEKQMVPSTYEKARKKVPTTTTTGRKGEG